MKDDMSLKERNKWWQKALKNEELRSVKSKKLNRWAVSVDKSVSQHYYFPKEKNARSHR